MAKYLIETHMHTSPVSACSDSRGREYISRYLDAGYSGIIVTDHFWHGYCGIDRSLPWPEFVKQFCAGYEDALEEGIKQGLPVFFGWEETFEGDDWLVYGLDKAWLIDHPEVVTWTREQQFEEVHRYGGCVVHAHPFRASWYIKGIHLTPRLADGIEGFNSGNDEKWNILGMRYAALSGLPVTAGSDNHHAKQMCKDNLSGVRLEEPIQTIRDYVRIIREKKPVEPVLPAPLPEWTEEIKPDLPVFWRDKAEEPLAEEEILRKLRHGFWK